jgi:hypothetical protein
VDFQAMLENNFIRQNIKNFHCWEYSAGSLGEADLK